MRHIPWQSHMSCLKLRQVTCLIQGHSARKWQCWRTQSCPTRKSCPFPLSQAADRKFFTTNPMWNRKPVSRDETTRPRSHRLQAMNKDPWAQVRLRGRPCSSYYCPEGAKGRILGWTSWKKESNCLIDCNVLGEVGVLRISRKKVKQPSDTSLGYLRPLGSRVAYKPDGRGTSPAAGRPWPSGWSSSPLFLAEPAAWPAYSPCTRAPPHPCETRSLRLTLAVPRLLPRPLRYPHPPLQPPWWDLTPSVLPRDPARGGRLGGGVSWVTGRGLKPCPAPYAKGRRDLQRKVRQFSGGLVLWLLLVCKRPWEVAQAWALKR